MQFRKLDKKEHDKTRPLWERVFKDDSKEFLDYYYSYKATDNDIYVIEEDGAIRAMLHLNPYRMQIGDKVETVHYIVGVATQAKYRKRGYMKMLLESVLQEMYDRGEPFTFLMPASEAIYAPYDFVTVYNQQYYRIEHPIKWQKTMEEQGFTFSRAIQVDCEDVAKFVTARLRNRYQIYAVRNAYYYETLLEEQKSQKGGIMLIQKEGKLVGTYLYTRENGYEVREPLFLKKCEKTLMDGIERDKKTKIMIRLLCTENLGMVMDGLYLNEIV